ncbi:MAG: hypothetical protein IKQ62_01015 [Bacteroidaceae bacterium]|nr:hypothetical protein [Bacteroidaceae bacterium]
MNKKHYTKTLAALGIAVLVLTACNLGRPNINGGKTGQPIMDGWTYEQAGEYWLPSVFSEKNPQTPEEVATLNKVNVQVNLPVHEGNPMPRDGVTYRQASSDGFITFHLSQPTHKADDDTIDTAIIGTADMFLRERMYFEQDSLTNARVKSWGKGIFTLYTVNKRIAKKAGATSDGMEFLPAIISVYPGGDSLLICRGNFTDDAYIADPPAPADELHTVAHITQRVNSFYKTMDDQKNCSEAYLKILNAAIESAAKFNTTPAKRCSIYPNHWTCGEDSDAQSPDWSYKILQVTNISAQRTEAVVSAGKERKSIARLILTLEQGDWYVDNFYIVTPQDSESEESNDSNQPSKRYDEKELLKIYTF